MDETTTARGRVRAFMRVWGGSSVREEHNGLQVVRMLGVREHAFHLYGQDILALLDPPAAWTDASVGVVYDLTHGWRDVDGDVWVCVGWLAPFDGGDPVPLMQRHTEFKELPELISDNGPLTARRET